jgi:hypothetical protein
LVWDGTTGHVIMVIPGPPPFTGEPPTELQALYLTHAKYAQTAERLGRGLEL